MAERASERAGRRPGKEGRRLRMDFGEPVSKINLGCWPTKRAAATPSLQHEISICGSTARQLARYTLDIDHPTRIGLDRIGSEL